MPTDRIEEKITDRGTLAALLAAAPGVTVFTNGCFDLLHAGHLALLRKARAFGDRLVVGVNSDDSVRRLKGERRPLVPAAERALLLAGLSVVDHVVVFDEDDPRTLLAALHPGIHVKGGDYRAADLPETPLVHSWGGRVEIVPLVPGLASSRLVKTILERYQR
jgi:rfaE bifunctional protein nucleotidyltransferase chain/domain